MIVVVLELLISYFPPLEDRKTNFMNPNIANFMAKACLRRLFVPLIIFCIVSLKPAQAKEIPDTNRPVIEHNAPKPYKVLTAGKRVTVQSKTEISKILVWTSSGRRIVEENNVKTSSYTFTAANGEKFFFIMLELKDGRRFTEKIGV